MLCSAKYLASCKYIISLHYDPDGNRIAKEVFVDSLHRWTNTYYVHDAQGNIMATYQWVNRDTFSLDELVMYGSSRLGTYGVNAVLCDTVTRDSAWCAEHDTSTNPFTDSVTYFTAGLKQYEFTNHLGNVLLTLTDRHIPLYFGGFIAYKPEVASAQDYYPFGMIMPGRNYNDTAFRFGFNNKENDNDVEGTGNLQNYGMRLYSPRLGRFPTVDPLTKKYPELSTYQFASNSPIHAIDLDGLEAITIDALMDIGGSDILSGGMTGAIKITPPAIATGEVILIPPVTTIPGGVVGTPPSISNTQMSKPIDWVNNPPKSPAELSEDWEETTHKDNKSGGKNREFTNKDTKEKIRFDKGDPTKTGWRKIDHWHRENPNKTGPDDAFLDRLGNPVKDRSNGSHIEAGIAAPFQITPTSATYPVDKVQLQQPKTLPKPSTPAEPKIQSTPSIPAQNKQQATPKTTVN